MSCDRFLVRNPASFIQHGSWRLLLLSVYFCFCFVSRVTAKTPWVKQDRGVCVWGGGYGVKQKRIELRASCATAASGGKKKSSGGECSGGNGAN